MQVLVTSKYVIGHTLIMKFERYIRMTDLTTRYLHSMHFVTVLLLVKPLTDYEN